MPWVAHAAVSVAALVGFSLMAGMFTLAEMGACMPCKHERAEC